MVSPFGSPCSTPRKSRKSHVGTKESKNPYSSRGLDKFSALLAELEEKRQKIYANIDSEDAPLVRFVYTSSGDCVPIVIKPSNKGRSSSSSPLKEAKRKILQDVKDKTIIHEPKLSNESKASSDKETKQSESDPEKKTERKPCPLNDNLHRMKRPSYYLPATLILVLVFLALFGRSVAILCTCIGWYVVPTIKDHSRSRRIAMKKKDFTRRLSNENKGSFNPRTIRDYAALKEKFPCLAARGRSA